MNYSIQQQSEQTIAGFHMVGPWEQTVKQGFEQLMMWVEGNALQPLAWVAVYYDNPDVVPAEKLRCDTMIRVADNFIIPPNSEGVIRTAIAAGDYACAKARVENHDFSTPWRQFFGGVLSDDRWDLAAKPCFEVYLNDGNQDGFWDIEMYIPVQRKSH